MRPTDENLRLLVAAGDKSAADELRQRVRWQLMRKLPNPKGTCPHGKRIEWDMRGAYSSGYPIGCQTCLNTDSFRQIVNDPPTEREKQLRAAIEALR